MIAFAFPGQGVQRAGLGLAWSAHPAWDLVDAVSEACAVDVEHLLLDDVSSGDLAATERAQPAVLTASLLALRALRAEGVAPDVCLGHSLGEVSALVASGTLDEVGAAMLVGHRSRAMAAACAGGRGTMVAVNGLPGSEVAACCAATRGAWVASENAPEQTVVGGARLAVAEVAAACTARGARSTVPLGVAGAFHTPLMAPAAHELEPVAAAIRFDRGDVAVVSGVDGRSHAGAEGWQGRLVAQLVQPVRWREASERAVTAGVTTFVEVGPGRVLGNLVRRRWPHLDVHYVASPNDVGMVASALLDARTP